MADQTLTPFLHITDSTDHLNTDQQATLDSGDAVTSFSENEKGELVITRTLDTTIAEDLNSIMRVANAGKSLDELRDTAKGGMVIGANIPIIAIEKWCELNGYTFHDFINASAGDELNTKFFAWLNGDAQEQWRCNDLEF